MPMKMVDCSPARIGVDGTGDQKPRTGAGKKVYHCFYLLGFIIEGFLQKEKQLYFYNPESEGQRFFDKA